MGADDATDETVLAPARRCMAAMRCAGSIIPPSARFRRPVACWPVKPPPLQRENRLYQADWLLRYYGFTVPEIAAGGAGGMLDLEIDPKLAWALKHRDRFPVDVNTAPREMLLRVPGLGARAVDKIIATRRHTRLRLADIARLSPGLKRAPALPDRRRSHPGAADRPRRPARAAGPPQQMSLFA